MIEKSTHYFARGNTALGAYSLYNSAFSGLKKTFVLTGSNDIGKSMVIQKLADYLVEKGEPVQCFHSPLRPDELDSIIVTNLELGIVDGLACERIPADESSEIIYINFDEALDRSCISEEKIAALKMELSDNYDKAFKSFQEALRIHDEWEKNYIANMDFVKIDQIEQGLIQTLYSGCGSNTPTVGRHFFFGAATPKGAIDFIQNITAKIERRIFIKGRPGTGKSTMLKKLASKAEKKGIEVQIFHCGFDPNSLDMLIFPELNVAIFDSTAPHEYFPDRAGDEILDVYELAITPGTDEKYATEIDEIKERYSKKMKEATSYLAEAEKIDSEIKSYYVKATDFEIITKFGQQIQSELDELIDNK